jgi:hypothetical protein
MKIDHMVDTNSERPRADLIALASNHADIRDALGLHAFPPNLDGVRRHFGEAWRCGSGAEKPITARSGRAIARRVTST